jgi:hypothetical protein
VTFDFEPSTAFDQMPERAGLPRRPRDYGQPEQMPELSAGLRSISRIPPVGMSSFPDPHRRTWVDKGSIIIRLGVGDLRQHATDTSDKVYVFLRGRPPDGILRGTWTATVRDIDGVVTGTVDMPVAEESVDLKTLLPADLGVARRR